MNSKCDCGYSFSFRARRLKALADACRLKVMELLLEGSKTVSEMLEKMDLEQSLLSYHLKILRQEGLIESIREGKSVRYRLADAAALQGPGRGINLGCCRLEMNF
ncbi:MAG: ArsR/SmtB family transcription factor [Desulfobaccales bacterium]